MRFPHLGFGMCNKADVNRLWRRNPLTQPKEDTVVGPEAFQVRMARRSVLPFEVKASRNANGGQDSLIKGN